MSGVAVGFVVRLHRSQLGSLSPVGGSRFFMNDTEERTERSNARPMNLESGHDDDEPPGKPRRHPLWRNVPKKQWDDWRWQSQNAIRSVRQLRQLLPFTPAELEAIGAL